VRKELKAIWELTRLEHGIMIALAIFVGFLIAQKVILEKFLFSFLTAILLESSTFALNDYYDYDIDVKNKRIDRPLVRGDLPRHLALYVFITLFPLGIICSFFINFTCFLIALCTAFLAFFYDLFLKRIKIVGNFFIAYCMAIPFIFGGAAVLEFSPPILIVALIAFLAGLGREIMKDVMDIKGDREKGVKSFPLYIGIRNSNLLSASFYILAIAFSFIPFFYHKNLFYLLVILVADSILFRTALHLILSKEIDLYHHRRTTLIALFIGILAFLIGAFS
jgi:geranylgeranylglycerol-phosphate geranylgeranyltransferase